MSAVSRHKYDVEKWIYKVIDSCTTVSQFMGAKKLVRLYDKKYPNKEFQYESPLMIWWDIKFDNLLKK